MDQILVNIYVLTIDDNFDMFIPINENVSNLITKIQKSIYELSNEEYVINPNAVLYNGIDGKIINPNNIVKFSGLTNGSRLLLV